MKPEDLVRKLEQALGKDIRSVILYGSAAAGDHVGKRSDYNILVVTNRLGVNELNALSKPSRAWLRAGNPTPLYFTLDRLQKSADVFPIEMMDIKESHKVLAGEDVLDQVEVHPENLRLILEHELKSSLIHLRESFLLTDGKSKKVIDLMVDSLSSFLVLFRAALRLYEQEVPPRKLDALARLRTHIQFDDGIFRRIEDLKEGSGSSRGVDATRMFETYLQTVESVVDAVDSHIHEA